VGLDKSIYMRALTVNKNSYINRIRNDIELKFSGLFQYDFERDRKRSINYH